MITDKLTNKLSLNKFPIWLVYLLGCMPALWNIYLGATGQLSFNPIKDLEHALGAWALNFLIITLAITPLRELFGLNLIRYRRAVGLLTFYYVLMHVSFYLLLEKQLDLQLIFDDILKRPYLTLGMIALVLLVPLAVTSNNYSIKRLGLKWRKLHMLVYPIAALVTLHYFLAVKSITAQPFTYISVIWLLLLYRLLKKPIKNRLKKNKLR